jgi:hypothetical protein
MNLAEAIEEIDSLEEAVVNEWGTDPGRPHPLADLRAFVIDSLDAAWAEAEAALPEGWNAVIIRRRMGGWVAETYDDGNHSNSANGWEQNLVAALRALTAKLREN